MLRGRTVRPKTSPKTSSTSWPGMSFIVVISIAPSFCLDSPFSVKGTCHEPIDLMQEGWLACRRRLPRRDRRGPGALRLRARTSLHRRAEGGARRRAASSSRDLRHLLLSHIHLDHAGAAGALVREHPALQVHVSESARRTSSTRRASSAARAGSTATTSTRSGASSPRCRRRTCTIVGDDVLGLQCFPTPGHASHHVSYLHADGTLYAGDAAGVRIPPGRHVAAGLPAAGHRRRGWAATIDEIERRAPERLALIHFGVADDVGRPPASGSREELRRWAGRVRGGMDEDEFVAAARTSSSRRPERRPPTYEQAAPLGQSYLGLRRYWDKRARDARAAASASSACPDVPRARRGLCYSRSSSRRGRR